MSKPVSRLSHRRGAPAIAVLALAVVAALPGCRREAPIAAERIDAVQGSGERSAIEGQRARVEGVVTLLMADGAFVQAVDAGAEANADPAADVGAGRAASRGLFVMPKVGQPALEVGQRIMADGTVAESGDGAVLTTLADAAISVLGTAALPEPIVLTEAPASWEALEGMRVRINAPLTVIGNNDLARFGEADLAFGGRVFSPTEVAMPGEAAQALRAENAARRIVLDDASTAENPSTIPWLAEPLSSAAPLRAGSTLWGLEAVVDERFGAHRLQAASAPVRIEQAPRPDAPAVDGAVRIAGMNLLNLFNGDGQGGGFPTERGARDYDGYMRQLAKHVSVISTLDPSIIAAQELENDGFGDESAARELADALNAAQPGARWAVVAPETRPGTDAIMVGILYRADRITAVGEPAVLTGGPFEYGSRPPVAQSFRSGRGPVFTVASIHFKSKGGCEEAEGANRDQNDGQGCFNAQRVESVERLKAWIATDPTASGSDRVALIGDFNAHAMEDPMRMLRDAGWVDPLAGEGSYSFVFDGQSGRLDHAMLSPSFYADLRGAAKWHVNADEATAFAYFGPQGREAGPWRSSDHDPMIFGFDPGAGAGR